MGQRLQKPRTRITMNTRTEVLEEHRTRSEKEREAIKEGLDEMLDEIDAVLEENAEQFVDSYIQKAGE